MTDINDVPQVNTLYTEQQNVQTAMNYLANGGTITYATVSPPAENMAPPAPGGPPTMATMMMTVSIQLYPPNPPEVIAAMQDALSQRNDEISQQLADLGVTGMRSAGR